MLPLPSRQGQCLSDIPSEASIVRDDGKTIGGMKPCESVFIRGCTAFCGLTFRRAPIAALANSPFK